VQSELGEELAILDGGPCQVGIESTIIDCTRGGPVLLRPGHITGEQIESACGRKLLTLEEEQAQAKVGLLAPKASGTLESHYAPNARVRLMDAKALQTALDLLGQDQLAAGARASIAVYARSKLYVRTPLVIHRNMPGDAAVAAHELFSVLRELDDAQVQLIWVERPPQDVAWDGVRDRLERAAA
jgi:L-threonylcarbamoyladenylate synthase